MNEIVAALDAHSTGLFQVAVVMLLLGIYRRVKQLTNKRTFSHRATGGMRMHPGSPYGPVMKFGSNHPDGSISSELQKSARHDLARHDDTLLLHVHNLTPYELLAKNRHNLIPTDQITDELLAMASHKVAEQLRQRRDMNS